MAVPPPKPVPSTLETQSPSDVPSVLAIMIAAQYRPSVSGMALCSVSMRTCGRTAPSAGWAAPAAAGRAGGPGAARGRQTIRTAGEQRDQERPTSRCTPASRSA